jgi:prepilin-type N-terminal cleavage/methylation domain-containing protein
MNNHQHKTVGFTLIEMVIVIAIIGLIAAIALPNYEKYIRKARRSEGMEALLIAAQRLEAYRGRTATYTNDIGKLKLDAENPGGYYGNLSISNDTDCPITSCYVIKIHAQNQQKKDNITAFKLSSTGKKERLEDGVWKTNWKE